jgi:hypothetical protein
MPLCQAHSPHWSRAGNSPRTRLRPAEQPRHTGQATGNPCCWSRGATFWLGPRDAALYAPLGRVPRIPWMCSPGRTGATSQPPFASIVTHRTPFSLCLRASLSSATVHRRTAQWPRPGTKLRGSRARYRTSARVSDTPFSNNDLSCHGISHSIPHSFRSQPTGSRLASLSARRHSHHNLHFSCESSLSLPHASTPPTLLTPLYFPDRENVFLPTKQFTTPPRYKHTPETVGSQSITQAFSVGSMTNEEGARKSWGSRQEAVVHIQAPFPFNIGRKGNDSVRRQSSTFASSPCCRKSSSTPKYTGFTHRSKNPAT